MPIWRLILTNPNKNPKYKTRVYNTLIVNAHIIHYIPIILQTMA
jgi:hypothetical protein